MHSFVYIPAIQGYDSSTWRTIEGAPKSHSGSLHLVASTCMSHASMLRGDLTIRANIPTPPATANVSRQIGLLRYGTNQKAYFDFVAGGSLMCRVGDINATTVDTANVPWDASWTGTDVDYTIIWEAGLVRFLINGVQAGIASYSLTLGAESVPDVPLSVYLSSMDSDDMLIKSVTMLNISSFYQPIDVDNTTFTTSFNLSNAVETITVSENVVALKT